MNIGIDVHGTIDSNPYHFKKFLKGLVEEGDTIFIISGPPGKQIKEELDKLKINLNEHYHKIISLVDFLKTNRAKMWQDENENWWCDDAIWWKSKFRICLIYHIDLLIDDKKEYQEYFKGSQIEFFLWSSKSGELDE